MSALPLDLSTQGLGLSYVNSRMLCVCLCACVRVCTARVCGIIAVLKSANSDVILRVLTSSCAEATAAVDVAALVNAIIAAAARDGITLTASDVSVIIAGCSASRRARNVPSSAGRALQSSSVTLDLSTSVSNLDSQSANTVRSGAWASAVCS